jgi:predicted DNA-binding transcriptional regulator AlpA
VLQSCSSLQLRTLERQLPRDIENGRERLLTTVETAKFLGVSESWLAKARMRGDGPPYVKIGRCVRYELSALIQWKQSRTRLSTSQY